MDEICANCKHNKKTQREFYCGNEESEYYGVPTAYDDTCEDWEGKDCTRTSL